LKRVFPADARYVLGIVSIDRLDGVRPFAVLLISRRLVAAEFGNEMMVNRTSSSNGQKQLACHQHFAVLFFALVDKSRKYPRHGSDEILTTGMVAQYLHCHVRSDYWLVSQGRIPHFRLGGDFRFERASH